jgi:hypothetical protein
LSNGIEQDAARQQLRQNVATAIRVAGEHDVGWDTATTDFVQCACNLRRSSDAANNDYLAANWSRASCADKRSP